MKNLSSLLLLFIPALAFSQAGHYSGFNVTADYMVKDGMLNGKYVSYYKNGKKKAEGIFENNCREGKWTAYDSTGTLKAEREYINPMEHRQIIPAISDSEMRLPNKHTYKPMRNADSYYTYSTLLQRNIIWSNRVWSYIYNSDNPAIAKNNMFKALYAQIHAHHITGYKNKKDLDQNFSDSVNFSATPLDTARLKVIGYMTKEDWFYDNDRNEMDCRIIGICPLATHTNNVVNAKFFSTNVEDGNKDTVGLFWIYYPQARKCLAQVKTNDIVGYPHVQNLEDIFFWRSYCEHIIQQRTLWPITKDSWSSVMQMIDLEHDIWTGTAQIAGRP